MIWAKLRPAAPRRAAKSANCSNWGTVSRRIPTFTLKGKLAGPTARKSADDALEGSLCRASDRAPRAVAPSRLNDTCVTASRCSIRSGHTRSKCHPLVTKLHCQGQLGHRRENVPELPVKRWLAAGEHDLLDAHRVARVPGDAGEEIDRKKVRRIVVERVFVTKAVAAVQIADVGQLDGQPARPVVRRSMRFVARQSFHYSRV